MYALNLAEDGRILSATKPEYAPAAYCVDTLPDGDISDWRIVGEERQLVYDPLPKEDPEPMPSVEEQLQELRSVNEMLMECLLEMSEIVYS